jgi:lysophospholipase L1-like esterase
MGGSGVLSLFAAVVLLSACGNQSPSHESNSGSSSTATGSSSTAAGDGGASPDAGGPHWVGTWTGAPQLTEQSNLPPAPLSNAVLRQVLHVSLGGSQIRVRFSNEFGNGPLTIQLAHVAVNPDFPADATIDTTTDQALAFSGSASTTIPEGMAVWSDPIDFKLAPLSNLAVTVAFGSVPTNVTGHPGSRTTSYEQTGGTDVSSADMTTAQATQHWYVLSGVDVMGDAAAKGLVILGDSITDGRGSTTDWNNRWTDDLAQRLQANAPTANVAIMNQGIGGNTVTTGGLGPPASQRYARDVLGQDGVRWVIIFEGVNDIGGGVPASTITTVFDAMISQAHAQNLLVYGATITPFGGYTAYYSAAAEAVRQSVNAYIRGGAFDGFIDFDAVVTDSGSPPKLQTMFDSGDGLHPNVAGYQAMAAAIDLTLFTK